MPSLFSRTIIFCFLFQALHSIFLSPAEAQIQTKTQNDASTEEQNHSYLRFGPMIFFELYHRKVPEHTHSVRLGWGLKFSTDLPLFNAHNPKSPTKLIGIEAAALYASNQDNFASTNFIDEKIYRGRFGFVLHPFSLDNPSIGFRLGVQYGFIKGQFVQNNKLFTEQTNIKYWSPYFGAEIFVLPLAGFTLEDDITVTYDNYYKDWMYQFSIILILR